MRIALLALMLLPVGCATYVANVAPGRMRGMAVPDLIACAGLPSQKMVTKPDVAVLEWDPKTPGSSNSGGAKSGVSFSLPLGVSFTWSTPIDTCHMQATVLRDGTVADIDMSSSNGVKGADGACGQIVTQCVYDQSSTGLPKGYDAFQYLFPETTPAKGKAP